MSKLPRSGKGHITVDSASGPIVSPSILEGQGAQTNRWSGTPMRDQRSGCRCCSTGTKDCLVGADECQPMRSKVRLSSNAVPQGCHPIRQSRSNPTLPLSSITCLAYRAYWSADTSPALPRMRKSVINERLATLELSLPEEVISAVTIWLDTSSPPNQAIGIASAECVLLRFWR